MYIELVFKQSQTGKVLKEYNAEKGLKENQRKQILKQCKQNSIYM
jgi:hypothetical protein